MESRRGDTIILPCEASGYPTPTIQWTLNGNPIRRGIGEDNSLTISGFSLRDIGEYTCVADNGVSSSSRTVSVLISGSDSHLTDADVCFVLRIWINSCLCSIEPLGARLSEHKQMYKVGDDMTLTCLSEGYPPPSIRWQRDDVDLKRIDNVDFSGETHCQCS